MSYNRRCVRLETCVHFINYWKHNGDISPENYVAYFRGKSSDQGKVSRAVARTREYTRHLEHILGENSTDQGKVFTAVARTREYTRHLAHILGENSTDQGKVSTAVARTREYTRHLEQTFVRRHLSIRTEHTRHNCTRDRTRRRQTTVTESVTT
jgi:hypothetical protein